MILRTKTVVLAGCFAALVSCSKPDSPEPAVSPDILDVATLSSAQDQITGDTVLVALTGDQAAVVARSGRFEMGDYPLEVLRHAEHTGRHEVLLGGLLPGADELRIRNAEGELMARLGLVVHPATGPIFSGPHQYPFVCSSLREWGQQPLVDHEEEWGFPVHDQSGAIIGYSKDCTIEPVVDYVYLNTEGHYAALPDDGQRPDDMVRTVLSDGREVDFVVRWERGTLNRFLYSYAVLADASDRGTEPREPGTIHWNGRLLYHFEGGVGIGHHQGSVNATRARLPEALAQGYAIAYSSGNRTSEHYNLQLGGETALMVKEHFIKRFGVPDYTVGLGSSGGAIQQYVYQQNHPGLLDGAIAQYSYPDMVSQIIHVGDCELLEHYMDVTDRDNPRWQQTDNRSLLTGFNATDAVPDPLAALKTQFGYSAAPGSSECQAAWRGLTPLAMNPHYGQVPGQDLMYPPDLMDDVVWTLYDDLRNVLGVDDNGWARAAWDNVGVQYGLRALQQGKLTPDEFIHLNAYVGGWKHPADMVQEGFPFVGEPTPDNFDPWSRRNMTLAAGDESVAPRTEGDVAAISALYESGMVFDGQLDIPVIDWRHYLEHVLDMHNVHQSFAIRQRIVNRMGEHGNQIIWITDGRPERMHDPTAAALDVMHDWITQARAHPQQSIAESRPDAARDACYAADGSLLAEGDDVWRGILDDGAAGACTAQFPVYGTSRIQAGGTIEGSVFKCALKPVAVAVSDGTYGSWTPDAGQVARLQEIFPQGVCDYHQPDQGRP